MYSVNYEMLIKKAPFAYALHRIVLDEQEKPCDYVFLEINEAFENMTGLKAENTVGKRVTTVLPGILSDQFDWIAFYGDIALNGGEKTFDQYSAPLNRWYRVMVHSPETGLFSTIFSDISSEKAKAEELERFFSVNLDLLCIADTDGNFLKVNEAWHEILGYSVEELAKNLIDVFRAGKINSEQEAALVAIEVTLGVKDNSCKHDMDSTCDANNVFHCNGCGVVVPQPTGSV